jgi:hypothetical protein
MKKTKLVVEYDFDFVLLGLASSFKGYKLAWELNKRLGLHLVKKEDILMGFKGNIERSFSCHVHQTNTRFIRLIRNKPQETDGGKYFLAPEYPHFDYLLVVQAGEQSFAENLLDAVRQIPSVELAAFIPLDTLKSKENFIF